MHVSVCVCGGGCVCVCGGGVCVCVCTYKLTTGVSDISTNLVTQNDCW